jgi:hypothetical protein
LATPSSSATNMEKRSSSFHTATWNSWCNAASAGVGSGPGIGGVAAFGEDPF